MTDAIIIKTGRGLISITLRHGDETVEDREFPQCAKFTFAESDNK